MRSVWKIIFFSLLTSLLPLLPASVIAQETSCQYQVTNEWGSGYTATITISNQSAASVSSWSVNWEYQANRINNLWNAMLSGDNPYTAKSLSWNGTLAPGASVEFGFQVDKNGGAAERPVVSGEICNTSSSSSFSSNSYASSSEPAMCNWYGSFYPYCEETLQGWGWENGRSCISETTCNSAPCSLSNCSSASSDASSSASFSSSSADYGSCPFTGVECVSLSGSWEYICAPGCTSQGPAPCISANMCRTYGNSSSITSSSPATSSAASSVTNSAGSSSSLAMCPFTGYECQDINGSWMYICAPGCTVQGNAPCGPISQCRFNVSSSSGISSSNSSSSSPSSSLKKLAGFRIGVAESAGSETNSIFRNDGGIDRTLIQQHFSQLTAGNIMKMSYLHPSENTYTFEHADQLVNYALENNITIHGHTLVWHSDYQIPTWMKNYTGDYATMLQEHVQTIATYYAGRVVSWDVVNEAFADDGDSNAINGYRNSLWYQKLGPDYIEQAFVAADAADPTADLYYNDYNMEGGQQKFDYVLAMIDDFKARDIPIDGVGFQMHINIEWPSESQIKNAFQQVVNRGLKVKVTELDIPVNTYANPDKYQTFTGEAAERQKDKYREVVAAYIDVVPPELRGGITVWGLYDSDSWLIDLHGRPDWPLLFNDLRQGKPALEGFAEGLSN